MFEDRFGTKWSKEGPERLKNVYFTYMLELRALVKAAPYIRKSQFFYTGNEKVGSRMKGFLEDENEEMVKEDLETKQALDHLFKLLTEFPNQFDESQLFSV